MRTHGVASTLTSAQLQTVFVLQALDGDQDDDLLEHGVLLQETDASQVVSLGFPKQAEQLYQVAFQFIFYTFSLQREIQQKTFGTFVNERHYLTKLQFVWRRHGGAAVGFFFHGVGEVVTRYLQHVTTGG